MIFYNKFQLSNGLRVIVHEDPTSPMAVLNILYDVGARDENPQKTGFAHLFEHLMFEGSAHIPDYDTHVHHAGGESNAFTGSDMTNYYVQLPAYNLETAFWLESDRMLGLDFNEQSLKVQKGVVVEEFNERCLSKPYGDVWHHLQALAYTEHPYQWPVIGKKIEHIEQAKLEDVKDFFFTHYRPNNAILTVAGGVSTAQVRLWAEKWFGDIPAAAPRVRQIAPEPPQTQPRRQILHAEVPADAIYLAFHMCSRQHPDYHAIDVLSTILGEGTSSRLSKALVKDQPMFSNLYASLSGNLDSGLFIIVGKLSEDTAPQAAEQALWEQLDLLKQQPISDEELQKTKNKMEATIAFSEVSLFDKAFDLAYFEWLGDLDEVNTEMEKYRNITAADILRVAQQLFVPENSCTLLYLKKEEQPSPNS